MIVCFRQGPLLLAGLATMTFVGCLLPPTSAQRLAESAYNFNMATRFGRTDIALEHVKASSREDIGRKHRAWGRDVRIDDSEVDTFSMRKDGDADVVITVSWHRVNDTTMRETELAQRWTDERGTWWLLREEERAGDHGVLPEATASSRADVSRISIPHVTVERDPRAARDP